MHVAILTRQIGHYHNARYRGAADAIEHVTVISTINQGGFSEFLAKETGGYDVERIFPNPDDYNAALAKGGVRQAIIETLDRLKPDAIAVLGWSMPESLAALAWGNQNQTPLIMMSETQADDAPRSFLREAIKRRIVGLSQSALVGGPPQAQYIEALGIDEDSIFYGYNAVDNDHFSEKSDAARKNAAEIRRALNLPECYILASARFIAKKNLPTLVKAYADARLKVDSAPDLVILGDGAEKSAIEAAITETGLADHVLLPGYRGYEDLPSLYGLSEGFAHVSTREQWGLVINEAMASAVPVLVSDRCGASRTLLKDGHSGWIVDPFDQADMTRALIALFSMTAEDRETMGQAARDDAKDWGPARFGSGLKQAAEKAISKTPARKAGPITQFILDRFSSKAIQSAID
ncbi:MAG: glycosyltransferase family 4 protein [Pseudomonadota bacterium]